MSSNGRKWTGRTGPGYIKPFSLITTSRIAVEEADQRGAELPVLKQVLGIYERMQEQGQGDLGTQAIIKAYPVNVGQKAASRAFSDAALLMD